MDLIRKHHLFRPIATITKHDSDLPKKMENDSTWYHVVNLTSPSSHSITTSSDEAADPPEEDIWYNIIFNADSNSIFTRLNETIVYGTNSDLFNDFSGSRSSSGSANGLLGEGGLEELYAGVGNSSVDNVTMLSGNDSSEWNRTMIVGEEFPWDMVQMVGTGALLGLIILATVIGNVFVIAAILLERNLQNVANYLILSLAVADLLVACLVMPLGAVYEVSHEWTLGPELCDMWTSSDVLCCTASILHLVAIALDRYWAVTNIDYIHQRTARRICVMIVVVWAVSFLVCIAPLLGWKDPGWQHRIEDKQCIVSQDISYQIFATASSFYLPLLVILILYWRIFQTARKRIRRRQVIANAACAAATATVKDNPAMGGIAGGLATATGTGGIAAAVVTIIGRPLPTISETTTTAFTNVSSNNTSPEKTSFANGLDDPPTTTDGGADRGSPYPSMPHPYPTKRKTKDSADSKRERKAAKTLAIITGAFVMCWLPFFVMAVMMPIYKDLFEEYIISFFLWLGYFNSTLNPIIYTIFSPEFRHAFKKILFGRNYARRRHKHCNIQ